MKKNKNELNHLSNEDYKNLFPFIEKVLIFYADKNNYKRNSDNAIIFPAIEMDCGNLAQSALKRIKDVNDLYEKSLNESNDFEENDVDEFIDNKLKEFENKIRGLFYR